MNGGRRLSLALALSLGLVLAVLAVPAGAADAGPDSVSRAIDQPSVDRVALDRGFDPPLGGEAAVRRATDGLNAGAFLNGLIDAAGSAVGATGPTGFALGASLFFIKQLIGSAEGGDEAQDAYAKLSEIDSKLTDLKNQLGENVFDMQVGKTDDYITDIRAAASDLRDALEHAKKADNKGLTEKERAQERRSFNSSMAEFLDDAHKLVQDNVIAKLNAALIDHQEEGDPRNPVKKPALLPQLRRKIAGEKFLTAERTARLRQFFRYYEWEQVRLGTVLTEYYLLGGPCTWSPPANYCDNPAPPKPADPDPGRAEDRVSTIEANIEQQRQAAGLPKKYLDEDPLRGRVFIDMKSNYMWGVEPAFRSSAQITRYGSFRGCGVRRQDYPESATCRLDAKDRFAGYDWVVPSMAEARTLFADSGDANPISWLRTAGLAFPKRVGARLSSQVALWLRDGWSLSTPERSTIFDPYTRSIEDVGLELADRDGDPYRRPEERVRAVASGCPVHQSLVPYYPIYNSPDCKRPDDRTGGYIVWVRTTTASDRADYYVTPPSR
jgi:hypothetical protein